MYEQLSIQELLDLCIERDILVPPEALDDRPQLLTLLRPQQKNNVEILKNYTKQPSKWSVQDFVRHFNKRYAQLSKILRARKELSSAMSISRILGKKERENVELIGMVFEKAESRNKHIVLTMEDPTGKIEVWIHASNKDLIELSKEIVHDEVLGIVGQVSNKRVFASNILFPDVPIHKELKKGVEEKYAIFVGDVEVGAKLFLKEEFEHFIMWISGKLGTPEQKEIANKVGYVIFIGDLVHGAGVYPNQHEDQNIIDIEEQYREFARYIKMIPEHIQIVLIAGNHDAGRLQEPQLPLYKDFAAELYALPNVTIVSNPSMINIDSSDRHPGFDLLLYHGYSLVYYSDNIQPIREAGGQKASDQIMRVYLRKRHLAPSHGSNTYVPDPDEDPLVIENVPDFLVTGHIHRVAYGTYNGVTMINAGCWNDVSDEQIKRGLAPQPAKLPMVNLRTRELRIMNFYPKKKEEEYARKKAEAEQ